jgi:hypothetical protein
LFGEAPFEFRIETEAPALDLQSFISAGPLKTWLETNAFLP